MKKSFLFITSMLCNICFLYAQQAGTHIISGVVQAASDNSVLEGVTLILEKSQTSAISDAQGHFTLIQSVYPDTLVVRHIGFKTKYVAISENSKNSLTIRLEATKTHLQEVVVSTGYQHIPQERATGSFDFINNKLLNRSVSNNILDRMENLTPGLLFNHGDAVYTDRFLIRGRSTIYANAQPLIVLDNFPYDGNLSNINPDDVESISILKDAAAASIWGARAGNGVIVITTKRGQARKPRIQFNTNVTIGQKPDISSLNTIPSSDFIGLEQFLFSKGFYSLDELYGQLNFGHPPFTPVIELLIAERDGLISASEANRQIEQLKDHDVRNDEKKYLYQTSINQQYGLNVSGNTDHVNYYMSAGWYNGQSNLVGEKDSRITLRSSNTFKISKRLQIDAGVNYVHRVNKNGNNPGYNIVGLNSRKNLFPYAQLANDDGVPIPVYLDYQMSYLDTVGKGELPDWTYNPITDIGYEDHSIKTQDYTINAGIRYKLTNNLQAEIKYQFENQIIANNDEHLGESYFARDMINKFAQPNSSGSYDYPVPQGGILDVFNTETTSHQGRIQLNYNRTWNKKHQLSAIAGWEIRNLTVDGSGYRLYGYDRSKDLVTSNIDFETRFKRFDNPYMTQSINNPQVISGTLDRFLSYFGNASYTYDNRFILSLSARKDETNLFGVKANQRGVPLWSVGGAWNINNEKFYKIDWLSQLKLRVTYGYQGNISRQTSAYTTATYIGSYDTDANSAKIQNPPNERLRWEKDRMINVGVDFSLKKNILSGSLEYYQKHETDLMGKAPTDPTVGVVNMGGESLFWGNVASMNGRGVDVNINVNTNGPVFTWHSTFIFGYASAWISKYDVPVSALGESYFNATYVNPVPKNPVYAIYSFKWEGLDPSNGNPLGYINGQKSSDYASIISKTTLDSMVYGGSVQPTIFGAFRNTFTWKKLSLSFNISYKFGYYFRSTSINYYSLFNYWGGIGSGDFSKRWQKPGDEKKTIVPSLIYPANSNRDLFYSHSEALVENGGNIRLEDVVLSYELNKSEIKHLPFDHIRVFLHASNLGTLWLANKHHIDPYFVNLPRNGKTFSLGFNINF